VQRYLHSSKVQPSRLVEALLVYVHHHSLAPHKNRVVFIVCLHFYLMQHPFATVSAISFLTSYFIILLFFILFLLSRNISLL
jgi:hypothetical protein